jgi:hypothetical protein
MIDMMLFSLKYRVLARDELALESFNVDMTIKEFTKRGIATVRLLLVQQDRDRFSYLVLTPVQLMKTLTTVDPNQFLPLRSADSRSRLGRICG